MSAVHGLRRENFIATRQIGKNSSNAGDNLVFGDSIH